MPTPAIVMVVSGFGKDGIFTCLCVCVCVCLFIINEENSVILGKTISREGEDIFSGLFFPCGWSKKASQEKQKRDTETSIQTAPVSRTTRHTRRVQHKGQGEEKTEKKRRRTTTSLFVVVAPALRSRKKERKR